MSNPLLNPTTLRTAITHDKALEITKVIMTSTDGDYIADALEAAASDSDLSHAVMMRLVSIARGFETLEDQKSGVQIVAESYQTPGIIYLPMSIR